MGLWLLCNPSYSFDPRMMRDSAGQLTYRENQRYSLPRAEAELPSQAQTRSSKLKLVCRCVRSKNVLLYATGILCTFIVRCFFVCLFVCFHFFFLGPHPRHMEDSRLGVRAAAASLYHSHSNMGSQLCLRPAPDPLSH